MTQLRPAFWSSWTLPAKFGLAGGVVMTIAGLIVGFWVSSRIEQGVVESSGAAAADYVENFVAPLSEDFRDADVISPIARRALEEIFASPTVRERVVSYKIWRPGGLVLLASNPDIVGERFEPSDDLTRAWTGEVAASFEDHGDEEDAGEAALGVPLLEVYSPVHAYFTGEVIAVVEFYQNASDLKAELADARLKTWLVVGSSFIGSGLLLFGIVHAGGRTISSQRRQLERQLEETHRISAQNVALRRRAVSASSRATAQAEKTIRRLGADLHDGPAQYLALAALRLDAALAAKGSDQAAAASVRESLETALHEIRAISRGLALPDLDSVDLKALIGRVIEEHERQAETRIELDIEATDGAPMNYAQKLCVYRFLQESLSNAARHADAERVEVRLKHGKNGLEVNVRDNGTGFEPKDALVLRDDGGQGLMGLLDRAESIGGSLEIASTPGKGASLTLKLPREEPAV